MQAVVIPHHIGNPPLVHMMGRVTHIVTSKLSKHKCSYMELMMLLAAKFLLGP